LLTVDTDPTKTIPPENAQPSQPSRRRWLRRFFFVLVGVAFVGVFAALTTGPEFHRVRLPVGGPLDGRDPSAAAVVAEQNARRLVTEVSALHAASARTGRWETVITEREVNAWLAIDLPKNHAALVGRWGTDARVEFLPGRFRFGCRMGVGPLATTAWLEADVRLRAPNRLGIVLTDARLGSLPIPRGPIIKELGRRLEQLGAVTEVRRFDDHSTLVVSLPSTTDAAGRGRWVESLLLSTGELALTGETKASSPLPQR
jgi:hypothetical protein